MTHQGDDIRHRYRPDSQKKWGERAANSGGYNNKSTDVWFYVAIIGFFVFLRFLPWILRRFGCMPPRPERVVLRRDPGDGENEEISEEERKKLVTKSLSTTKVIKHSSAICSGECAERQAEFTGKEDPPTISLVSVNTVTVDRGDREDNDEGGEVGEDIGDSDEASSNDDQTTLHPCHICLDHFQIGEDISWSNVSKCEHCFHTRCINEWLLKHQACPLCRADMLDLTCLQRSGDSEEGREEDQVPAVRIEVANDSDAPFNSLSPNEEELAKAEEGRAKSIKNDAAENRQNEGEMMCFCVEHGLLLKVI